MILVIYRQVLHQEITVECHGICQIIPMYCMTKQTSAQWNTTAGYWANAYRVIHTKRAAARTHDACVFTTRQ